MFSTATENQGLDPGVPTGEGQKKKLAWRKRPTGNDSQRRGAIREQRIRDTQEAKMKGPAALK